MTLFPLEQQLLESDDYYTPLWVFNLLGLTFDIDVAAPPGGIPWIPAHRYFTMAEDGLSQPWEGRVWMNPPWSETTPWISRFIEHRHGIALLPGGFRRWFFRIWSEADAVACPEPRISFLRPVGARGDVAFQVFFAAFGEECVDALRRVGHVR